MTAHELAKRLLDGPDLPVVVSVMDGGAHSAEVTDVYSGDVSFDGANDGDAAPRSRLGWQLPRPAVFFRDCGP